MTASAFRPAGPPPFQERGGSSSEPGAEERAVTRALALMFLPLHKRKLGIAVGVAVACVIAAVSLVGIVRGGEIRQALGLLSVFFRGYSVTWPGLVIGAAWGGLMGFVAGWFVAFCRNFVLATWLIFIRVKANTLQTRDFLDHI